MLRMSVKGKTMSLSSLNLRLITDIFRWVAENVRYADGLPNDRGALYAIKKKEGDCSEFHRFRFSGNGLTVKMSQ